MIEGNRPDGIPHSALRALGLRGNDNSAHMNLHEVREEIIRQNVLDMTGRRRETNVRIDTSHVDLGLYAAIIFFPVWLAVLPFIAWWKIYKLNKGYQPLTGFHARFGQGFAAAILGATCASPVVLAWEVLASPSPFLWMGAIPPLIAAYAGWRIPIYLLPIALLLYPLVATGLLLYLWG